MSDFGIYTGEEFLSKTFPQRAFLIDGYIRERDSVILAGASKAGKSLVLFQMICSMTSCHPFLDTYAIPRPLKVTYVQLEGELSDYQDRMRRMRKLVELNPDNLQYIYWPPTDFSSEKNCDKLIKAISAYHRPDLIAFDPIYFCIAGSLSDDVTVRRFLGYLRIIKDHFGCAIVLTHHFHKMKIDPLMGIVIDEGNDSVFGSVFFQAFVDHQILLSVDPKTKIRTLACTLQRDSKVIEKANLRLIEPDPLYFELTEGETTSEAIILKDLMEKGPGSADQIMSRTGIKHASFYRSLKPLETQKLVTKTQGTRPVIYSLRNP